MNEIDLKRIYANQVVIYQLLSKIISKMENSTKFYGFETYMRELDKHAAEVLKKL